MKVYTTKTEVKSHLKSNLITFLIALSLLPAFMALKSNLTDDSFGTSEVSANTAEVVLKDQAKITDKTSIDDISAYFEQNEPVYSSVTYQAAQASQSSQASQNVASVSTNVANYLYPNQIAIGGNIIPIFYSSNTAIDAGMRVGLWGTHFLYGHNYGSIFGVLAYLPDGTRFSVTLDGVTRNYQIVGRVTLDYTDPSRDDYAQKHMYSLAVLGAYQGIYYDYVMMTCAGQSLGNGNATHRLVVFANEI